MSDVENNSIPEQYDVVLRNVRRIASANQSALDTALLPQMIGGETSNNTLGWKRPDGVTHYYQPKGGNSTYYGSMGIGVESLGAYTLAVVGDVSVVGDIDADFGDAGGIGRFSASGIQSFRDNMYVSNVSEGGVGAINFIADRGLFQVVDGTVMMSVKDGTVAINTEDELEGYELIVDGKVGARGGFDAVWDVPADVVQFNGSGVNTDRPNIYYAQGGGTDRLMEFITTGRQEWWTNNIKRMELDNVGELHLSSRSDSDYAVFRMGETSGKYFVANDADHSTDPHTFAMNNADGDLLFYAGLVSQGTEKFTIGSDGAITTHSTYVPTVAKSIVTKDYVDDLPFIESALVPDPAVTSHDLKSYAEGNNILLGGQVYFNTGIAHDTIIGTLGGNTGGRKVIPAIARNYTAPTTTIPVLVVWQSSGVMNLWMGDDEASTGECRIFFDGITVRASQNTPFDEPETLEVEEN